MPKSSKKFIDRKNAVTFHLVHRSLKDPLAEDESAPQRVLVPSVPEKKDRKKQLEEQQKFGVYFDDDYNYLQHLREAENTMEWVKAEPEVKPQPKIQLPSSVFASKVEDDTNSRAVHGFEAPIDQDVVDAMDDDFDFNNPDNELEDNFFELANKDVDNSSLDIIDEEDEESEDESTYSEGDDSTSDDEFPECLETEKKQSTYEILTTTVRNRNQNLRFIDAQCEKLLADWEADEEEDNDDKMMPSEMFLKYCEEYLEVQPKVLLDRDDDTIETTKRLAHQLGTLSEEEYEEIDIPVKAAWGCTSVNGTSTTSNQPKSIPVPRNLAKAKLNLIRASLPKQNVEDNSSEGEESDCFETESIASRVSALSIRNKNETPEERRERKKHLKEFRCERRKEKKVHKLAFKNEYLRQVQMDHAKQTNAAGKKIL